MNYPYYAATSSRERAGKPGMAAWLGSHLDCKKWSKKQAQGSKSPTSGSIFDQEMRKFLIYPAANRYTFKKVCVSEQSRSRSKHLSLYPRFDLRDDVCNPLRMSSGLHLEPDPFACWPKRDLQRSSLTRFVQVPMLRTWIGTQRASDAYL